MIITRLIRDQLARRQCIGNDGTLTYYMHLWRAKETSLVISSGR